MCMVGVCVYEKTSCPQSESKLGGSQQSAWVRVQSKHKAVRYRNLWKAGKRRLAVLGQCKAREFPRAVQIRLEGREKDTDDDILRRDPLI